MDILAQIIERKEAEVALLKENIKSDPSNVLNTAVVPPENKSKADKQCAHCFLHALKSEDGTARIISEIKRKSPSAGSINKIPDVGLLAKAYEEGGAACISCLTDYESFGGCLDDLKCVAKTVKIPILRKDFIVDRLQIAEAANAGASAVLLMVSVLGERVRTFMDYCDEFEIDCLVEVHTEDELDIAVNAGAKIIGVNNRDLKTFVTDLAVCEKLLPKIPSHVVKVGESGIHKVEDVQRMINAGANAVLIGESLVRSDDPKSLIESMRQCKKMS